MLKITRESIYKAIETLDKSPDLKNGRESRDYDLVLDNGKTYPPILVLSEANKLLGGDEVLLSHFGNSTTKPFNILTELGFQIIKKSFYPYLLDFIDTANSQVTGEGTNEKATSFKKKVPMKFRGLTVDVSFGIGRATGIPWVSFLGNGQKTSNGIYPVYLFFKEYRLLILAYGISETNTPIRSWNLNDGKTILDFFKEKQLGKPRNYGSSMIFKTYDTDRTLVREEIDADLDRLITLYQQTLTTETIHIEPLVSKENFNYRSFLEVAREANFQLSEILCLRFIASLLTKPFVILTGLSGSGKTKLAQAFAKWITISEDQVCQVPVGADWTNREPLLGYPSALEAGKYIIPENGALELIIEASCNASKPFFLILDEMNLSHVERYFADFLSAMESKEAIPLHSGESKWNTVPPVIKLPDNLFIVGTVNIDETTYMFSPKVLDRANVIEFRVDETEMKSFLAGSTILQFDELLGKGANMAEDFLWKSRNKYQSLPIQKDISDGLLLFFNQLTQVGAEFGYRTASEIIRFVTVTTEMNSSWTKEQIFDAAIMQKLLPKLHGSRRKLELPLKTLAELCLHDKSLVADSLNPKKNIDFKDIQKIKFPVSLEKIRRMNIGLIHNNFTSYAEA